MWLGLKPSQNLVWDSNPHGWDSNRAKTHGTWFKNLMKLKFLMSHHRKNSVRDKVIGEKWVYLERNISTDRVWSISDERPPNMGWLVFVD